MSLVVAVPCAIGAACAYGTSNAVQHSAANTGTGQADAKGLVRLLRNPRWLASVGGDLVGLVLQVIALATGPVVLISPLLVLAVPISLPVGWYLGGPRPSRADYLACLAILVGLGLFTALVGDPGDGRGVEPSLLVMVILGAAALAVSACVAVRHAPANVRAGVYGAVSGSGFGLVAVLVNSAGHVFTSEGIDGLLSPAGLVPIFGAMIVGVCSMVVLQVAFQVGSLAASFPANEAAAPLVAVTLGTVLLHQNLPVDAWHLLAYLFCYGLVVAGTIELGQRQAQAADADAHRHPDRAGHPVEPLPATRPPEDPALPPTASGRAAQ